MHCIQFTIVLLVSLLNEFDNGWTEHGVTDGRSDGRTAGLTIKQPDERVDSKVNFSVVGPLRNGSLSLRYIDVAY